MQTKAMLLPPRVRPSLSQDRRSRLLLMGLLFVAAFALRIYHITDPPLDFHPTRQYHSAIIARGCFLEMSQPHPDEQARVAILNKNQQRFLEPRIMETLASWAYYIAGREHLWIPRLFAITFWLAGALFLYALARDLLSPGAAVMAAGFYLFLPFGISASRSFQPDPLMICAFLASMLAICRYHMQPSGPRFVVAAVVSASAIFVKPVCLFAILAGFMAASVSRCGIRRALTGRSLLLFGTISLLPVLLFYVHGMLLGGFLRGQAGSLLIPGLYVSSKFWLDWLSQINGVVGYPNLLLGLVGLFLFPRGLPRAFLAGLWVGYFLFGLTFNYHIHTHDYYQLQLVPIVALSIAPVGLVLLNWLARDGVRTCRQLAAVGILLLASVIYLGEVHRRLTGWDRSEIPTAQQAAAGAHHSRRALFLSRHYGLALRYHGSVSGEAWPYTGDIHYERLKGARIPTAGQRLDSLIAELGYVCFIVTDLEELDRQGDLRRYLTKAFRPIAQGSGYVVFDLTDRIHLSLPSAPP